jgi:hypothetical protein
VDKLFLEERRTVQPVPDARNDDQGKGKPPRLFDWHSRVFRTDEVDALRRYLRGMGTGGFQETRRAGQRRFR